jgi:hypothetical protein
MNLASLARRIRLLLISLFGVAAVAPLEACGSDDGLSSIVDDDAGGPIEHGDSPPSSDDGGSSLATLRLAHLAPELGAIDFCYAALTGSLEGPILGGGVPASDAAVEADGSDASVDASATGFAYGAVTKYFSLKATGTITIALVHAGATSCTSPIAEGTVTLDPGKLSTAAVFGSSAPDGGDAGASTTILAFIDDRETRADRARVRMIHGATVGALSVSVTGASTTVVAGRLEPKKATTASQMIPVDALGFATIAPVAPPASLVVSPLGSDGGSTTTTTPADLDLRGDSLHTGFVLDGTDGGLSVLWCADKSTTAELTACSLLR